MKLTRNSLIVAKVEARYGTDAAPAAATDSILISNLSATPASLRTADRAYYKGHLGASPQLVVGASVELSFDVELASSGAAGTAPGYGSLLRACGMAETTDKNKSVSYAPVSTGFSSLTIHYFADGVRQAVTGARGSVSLQLSPGGIPVASFSFTGKYAAPTDMANPNDASFAKFKTPVATSNANASVTLHGHSAKVDDLSIDLGNQIVHRELIGADEIIITDRAPTGNASIHLTTVADKNWVDLVAKATLGTLKVVLGKAAGAIVEIDAPKVQLENPTHGDSDGVRTIGLGLRLVPDKGNDELKLTFK